MFKWCHSQTLLISIEIYAVSVVLMTYFIQFHAVEYKYSSMQKKHHSHIFPCPFGAWKNTMQRAKYLCKLYVITSNEVCILHTIRSIVIKYAICINGVQLYLNKAEYHPKCKCICKATSLSQQTQGTYYTTSYLG